MKKLLLNVALAVSILFSTTSFAADSHYSIIIDAGSSGSRLHLFQHNADKNMPVVTEVFTVKNTTPLNSFANHPEKSGESLKPLFDDAVKKLHDDNITEVIPTSVLGTAGMRLLPTDQQQAIYLNIKNFIEASYKNTLITSEVQTISGKIEGVYDWLDVNYLLKNFQNQTPTAGSIEMGSASTQIAYATQKMTKPIDETNLTINGKKYTVFSKSFLGLGQDQTHQGMRVDQDAKSCYPTDAPFDQGNTGHFNLVICKSIYHQIIESFEVQKQILPVYKVPTFIAFNGAYYTYHFFGVDPSPPDQETLEQTVIDPICNNSWESLKESYPYEPEHLLTNYCANIIYVTDLFYNAYQVQDSQLKVLSTINNQKIDWALGAMLYQLIKNEKK